MMEMTSFFEFITLQLIYKKCTFAVVKRLQLLQHNTMMKTCSAQFYSTLNSQQRICQVSNDRITNSFTSHSTHT